MKRLSLPQLLERWVLPSVISLVVLVDGILHLRLDYLLFNGTLWGTPKMGGPPPGGGGPPRGGPPPGGPAPSNPFPFPLNEMFFLNFLAAIGLVLAFWIFYRWFRRWLWLVDLGIVGFAAFSIWGWWKVGEPNPQQLGYITKGLEVALIVLVIVQSWLVIKLFGLPGRAARAFSKRSPAQ